MAITDGLTGLYNRRYMESHLGTLVEQAAARGKPLTVLVLDIDYFKAINDTHGHDAGDDVLREFAIRMRKSIRGIDLACRYGGEEFVVVMPETDMAVAAIVAERLRRRIASEPFAIEQGGRSIEVTISIGIAGARAAGDNAAAVLKRADQALYRAKRDGRNRVGRRRGVRVNRAHGQPVMFSGCTRILVARKSITFRLTLIVGDPRCALVCFRGAVEVA